MGRVDSEIIKKASTAVANVSKMKTILDALQEAEPEFLNWVQASTREELARFSDLPLHPGIIDSFQSTLMKSKVISYYMHHLAYTDIWKQGSAMLTNEYEKATAIYDAWTSGELPEQFYQKSPKKGTVAYKAKSAFQNKKKERKAITKMIDEVSTKMSTMRATGIDPDAILEAPEIPYLLETGVIETPR